MRLRHALLRIAGLGSIAIVVAAFAGTAGAEAGVEVPFATQFASSGHGGVTIAANTLMTCPASGAIEAQCLAARAGTATGAALNNNAYLMNVEDIDGDPGTFDSSSATLSLPAGATVTFAGLYYGAKIGRGEESTGAPPPQPSARGNVALKVPGAPLYTPLTASVNDSSGIKTAYAAFVDVTSLVAAAGPGDYTVANVQAGTGKGQYAGWALVVAYSDPASPPRSIRVYGGLASIVAGEPSLQIPVTGLETPPAGSVSAEIGLVAYEGDRGGSNSDRLVLAGKELSDAANPANNVFNSTIATDGVDIASKSPNYDNQLGFDADLINANGFLGNGATEATLEESTRIEQYLTQAIAVAVELDPDALEPPVSEPPPSPPTPAPPVAPAPAPPAPEAPTGGGKKKHREKEEGAGKGSEEATPKAEPPALELAVAAPEDVVRPTAVLPLRVTVESTGDEPVRGLTVCNRLPRGLTRLRAAGADVSGAVACWKVPKLAGGAKRTFLTTARVDTTGRANLSSTTIVGAKNTRSRRRETRIRVAPLPPTACGSSVPAAGFRLTRRC